MKPIVEIQDLRVEYRGKGLGQGTKVAVDGLNLSVNTGEVFGFLQSPRRFFRLIVPAPPDRPSLRDRRFPHS